MLIEKNLLRFYLNDQFNLNSSWRNSLEIFRTIRIVTLNSGWEKWRLQRGNLSHIHKDLWRPYLLEPSRNFIHAIMLKMKRACGIDPKVERSGKLISGCVWFQPRIKQHLETALQLTNQVAAATSIFSLLRCTQTLFPCRRLVPCSTGWFRCLSRLAVPSSPFYISVNTQYLSNQRLSFLSLEAHLILETTIGYCWRLVFLGF